MISKVRAALVTSLGVALAFASSQALAQGAPGVRPAPIHSTVRSAVAHHHHIGRNDNHRIGRDVGTFFPGGFFWGSSNMQPNVEVAQPLSAPITGDIHYTYKYDVPWDWAHRYPPSFFASPPEPPAPPMAYRSGCPAQAVTVPGADGKDQTITVVRC
jgi:hypothetical protein